MLSKIPFDIERLSSENMEKEILRASIIAELDAINLYEQLAALTVNEALKRVLLDVAREEKTHVGEFQAMLLKVDQEQAHELEEGSREVKDLTAY